MSIKIALAGNPNSGKTTLFNALTGSNQYVGNWPGVTVEKKEGGLKGHKDVVIQDLPGIYSLSPYSIEENVSRMYLVQEKPDAILNIVDGTNIERNLYLTTQLAELGRPLVIAVNMMDLVDKSGDKIDFAKVGKLLGAEVIGISAQRGNGCQEAAEKAVELAKAVAKKEAPHVFTGSVEHAIAHIEESLQGKVPQEAIRWYAIKVFERDKNILAALKLDDALAAHLEQHIKDCEKELDDDAEAIITSQRYAYIQKIIADAVVKNKKNAARVSLSDRIDRFVTNRILALPIFFLSLVAMYWLAVSDGGPGTVLTDWANDGLLGDGWFLPFTQHEYASPEGTADADKPWFEGMDFDTASEEYEPHEKNIEAWEGAYKDAFDEKFGEGKYDEALADFNEKAEKEFKPENEGDEFEASEFEVFAGWLDPAEVTAEAWLEDEDTGEVLAGEYKVGEDGKIEVERCECEEDAQEECKHEDLKWVCTYKMYEASKEVQELDEGDFGVWIPGLAAAAEGWVESAGIEGLAAALINNGLIGGVATVLGFVPVIAIVFLFLAFLEDCGYMARVAFIMDRIFRSFGLSGKSFIPMLVGKGCGVPAVMAARTIENVRDQRMTITLCTFMPCGAKTVIITMFTAAFFREYWYVAALMDILGVAIIVLGGIALKKSRWFAGEAAPFVMELPAYHLPTLGNILRHTWTRVRAYAIKAGTVIFAACVVLTLMMTFDWHLNVLEEEQIGESILASIGNSIAWLFAPLGFGTWQGATATLSAEIAKEQATATLAMVAGGDGSTIQNVVALFKTFSPFPAMSALSFMLFNLFVPPCLVAIVNTFKEMGSAKWGWFATIFQLFVGYVIALNAFQIGALLTDSSLLSTGNYIALAVAAVIDLFVLWAIFRPAPKRTVVA
ncbi:MAG: ferrous iron transporter B [Kiritimatiellae bacterium]|nr:ferrous iron transporter B [Kiritimatiellia bacterium]